MDLSVLDKIKKLYALAERAGTEAEGALAAEMMQDLCRKHKLDPTALFGPEWRRLARKFVTEIRFEKERRVHESRTWTQDIEHVLGPCLNCGVEIEYVGLAHAKKWIARQFEENARSRLLKSLEAGRIKIVPSFNYLCDILCELCRARFAKIRNQRLQELQREKERKKQHERKLYEEQRRREAWERTWRRPKPAEFDRTEGQAAFSASVGRTSHQILFRWRISNRCRCRGSNAGAVVGMWVDGRLVAHYHGWDLTGEDDYDSQDRFGWGFRCWFQRKLQNRLLRARPDLTWSVLDDKLMREPDCSGPWIVHVRWHDGQVHAKVGPLATIKDVTEFARARLRMEIADCDSRVARAAVDR